jgi:hypothetical protein
MADSIRLISFKRLLQGLRSALSTRCSSADPLPENPTKSVLRSLPKV